MSKIFKLVNLGSTIFSFSFHYFFFLHLNLFYLLLINLEYCKFNLFHQLLLRHSLVLLVSQSLLWFKIHWHTLSSWRIYHLIDFDYISSSLLAHPYGYGILSHSIRSFVGRMKEQCSRPSSNISILIELPEIYSRIFMLLSQLIKFPPAILATLWILKLIKGKILHGPKILNVFFLFEMRNGSLVQVNSQKSFDLLPIFNILFSLLDLHRTIMNHCLFIRLLFKHGLELKFAIL